MVDILAAVLTEGRLAVEAACAAALNQGVHSADVILNILARRRDPAPALTILTADALKLRHAPVADCAHSTASDTRVDLMTAVMADRTRLFDLMAELKLFGMRSAYDEVMGNGIKRQREPPRIVGIC